MNTAVVVLVLAVVVVVGVVVLMVLGNASTGPKGPSRRERELEAQLDVVRELAYQYRDVDQGLAEAIIDQIAKFNRKELS